MQYLVLLYVIIFIFGIVIGSFLNVCIYRLPLEESIAKGSSHCMKCGTKIKRYDLIPLFSWVILGGKCRSCKEKISFRYPAIEFLNGILWVISFIRFDFTLKGLIFAILFSALIVIFFMDFDTKLISVGVVIFIGFLAVPYYILIGDVNLSSHLIGALAVSFPLLIINLASKGRAMGLGDVYLMVGAGLLLGLKGVAVAIFFGLILGSIGGLMLKRINHSSVFAFGPFLSLGIAISALYGTELFDWYINFAMLTPQ